MARPRTPLIDKQEVLEKALEIVERDGVDRLSVRALGEALGVKWASLYYHFEDKDAILDGVAKLALVQRADINVDQSAPWDEQIVALSVGVYRTLMRHPNLVALLVRRADRAFATASHRHVAQKLIDGGFPPDLVVPVMDSLEGYLIGMATIDAHAADAVPYGEGLDDAPAIRAALDADPLDPAVRYELGVRALLAGWAERAREGAPASRRRHDELARPTVRTRSRPGATNGGRPPRRRAPS